MTSLLNKTQGRRNTETTSGAQRADLIAQVELLRQEKARLEAEIAEWRRAADRGLADAQKPSELSLRMIFDSTMDSIVVLRIAKEGDDPAAASAQPAAATQPETATIEMGNGPLPDGLVARYIDVNREFERQFGFARHEVIGKKFGELEGLIDAEARGRIVDQLFKTAAIHNLEAELHSKDGRDIPCLLSGRLIEAQGALYAVGIVRNISELKETQRRLHQSEETSRRLFDVSLDRMTISDLQTGTFIDVNREFVRATGYSREEVVGKRTRDYSAFANPEDAGRLADELRKQGEVRNMGIDLLSKGGKAVPCLLSAALFEFRGHICCLTVTRDISEFKETERQLMEAREAALGASRAKSEFLSSMSHEIRTPMNAVLGMAELLSETNLDPEQRKYLSIMINNGNSLLELINDILDLAKVEAGRLELEHAPFEICELTDRVCETLAVRAHSKHVELACRVVPGIATAVVGDALRLRQILINLIGNAIKFTQQGSIILTVDQQAREAGAAVLHFSVADTGIGIAPDKIDKIFGSFTQADSSTTRTYGGSGLGLSIVKRLVELMGGKIWVESELGKGSTFHFTARLEQQAEDPAKPARVTAALDLGGMRALIVDDTPVNRVILREALSARGAVVTEAENGEQALARLAEASQSGAPFDLLVLDCRMPGMDGLEVASRIKTGTDGCRIMTLMLTSDDFNIRTARLRELGIQGYLVKPVRRAELYNTIASAMALADVKAKKEAAAPAQPAVITQASARRPLRILLADDSPDNRLLISAYLKQTPHQLEMAENGKIAVNKFTSGGPHDLILMDMQMPVMDGYCATREIRRLEAERGAPRIPIIALTASALKEDQAKSAAAGCDLHVAKPVRKAVLLAAIQDLFKEPPENETRDGAPRADQPATGAPRPA